MNKSKREFYSTQFEKLYRQLNPAQQQAVDTIEGPVLVVAGPGTGKTQVLSARIANILRKTDAAAHNILALTFTESAAKNMQERVVSMIGTEGYYVEITTFHAFCASVITAYPEYFPISREAQAITDVELFETIKNCIHDLPLETLKPLNAPYFYLKDVVRAISQLKREGITPVAFTELIAQLYADESRPEKKTALAQFEKMKAKNTELAQIYAHYQEKLLALQRYDFDDMIGLVIAAFQNEETLLLEYQEKFHYFLVDEYQDTNAAQNKVVQLLASYWEAAANIFVVGDPHQSIYRFQGASTENVIGFTQQYPQATVITLGTSYRCPAELTNVAHTVIGNNVLTQSFTPSNPAGKTLLQALTQPLQAVHAHELAVQVLAAPSQTIELIQVAEAITALLAKGVRADEIAILYRTNKESLELSEVLEKWQIPYEIDGGTNVLEFEPIRQLLQLLQVVELYKTGQEDERFFEVLCYEWLQLHSLHVYKLSHLAGKERLKIQDLIGQGYEALNVLHPECLTEDEFAQFTTFLQNLSRWASLDGQLTFIDWFETVVSESGFLNWIKEQPAVVEQLVYLHTLRQRIEQFCHEQPNFKLRSFLAAIETMRTYGIALIAQDLNVRVGAVHLSTVHKAKGQEWPYVFVIHCVDGLWGNTRERNLLPLPAEILHNTDITKKERNEDDRRLLYVALTRAKQQVVVSYPETIISPTGVKDTNPSMFVAEMQAAVSTKTIQFDQSLADQQAAYLTKLVEPAAVTSHTVQAKNFFAQIISNYSLSVSGLNHYLQDPAQFILHDLLLIPSGHAPYLAFGTAIHAALEALFKQIIQGTPVNQASVYEVYKTTLQKEILMPEDFERRLAHGQSVLQHYIDTVNLAAVKPWQLEARFGYGMRRTVLRDIPLVGRIDRLDWIDQVKKTVRVIDYKTGSSKTRNTLEGRTQSAGLSERELSLPEPIRSPYKRQLLFYKLLTELDTSFIPTVEQGVFEFVVPDAQSGKTVTHAFDLPDAEVAELKELIITVMKELRELQFLEFLPAAISTVGTGNK